MEFFHIFRAHEYIKLRKWKNGKTYFAELLATTLYKVLWKMNSVKRVH